jgi:hypothetical protein
LAWRSTSILLANPVAAESAIVGTYTQRDVDSQAQLFILDDKTFCFTFTGGALDLVKAGRWEVGADGIILEQHDGGGGEQGLA